MAKKNTKGKEKLNYAAEVKRLKTDGPERLYLLYGPEDYLREQFLIQLKKICLPDGESSFSFRRFDGPGLDMKDLYAAVDAMPFMSELSFIELHDVDINRLKEPEEFIKLMADIPDYCVLVFVQNSQFEPDGRLKQIKAIRENGRDMCFAQQSQGQLFDWIGRRFAAAGKNVDFDAVQRLIFVSGDLMNRLIPEIEKIAAYSEGERVTIKDVDAVAHHIPEADIFNMTDCIANRQYNNAVEILSELLADSAMKDGAIYILATLGAQLRKLYAARIALDRGMGEKYVMDTCSVKYEFMAQKLMRSARGFSLEQLGDMLVLCAEADYKMKCSSLDDNDILVETMMRIAARTENA